MNPSASLFTWLPELLPAFTHAAMPQESVGGMHVSVCETIV